MKQRTHSSLGKFIPHDRLHVGQSTRNRQQRIVDGKDRLAEKAAGIDPKTLRQICVFDPADLIAPDQEPDSTENH